MSAGPFDGRVDGWRYTGGEFLFRVVYEDDHIEDLSKEEIEDLITQRPAPSNYSQQNRNKALDMAVLRWKIRREKYAGAVRHSMQLC